jgi:hypothetical protein
MKVLRQVGDVQLMEGQLMSKGLNNLFNTKTKQVSLWFDNDFKNELMVMSDNEFLEEADYQFDVAEMQP